MGDRESGRKTSYVKVQIAGRPIVTKMVVDINNAGHDLISESLVERLHLEYTLLPHPTSIDVAGGTFEVIGQCPPFQVFVNQMSQGVTLTPLVVAGLPQPLNVGRHFLGRHRSRLVFSPRGGALQIADQLTPLIAESDRTTLQRRAGTGHRKGAVPRPMGEPPPGRQTLNRLEEPRTEKSWCDGVLEEGKATRYVSDRTTRFRSPAFAAEKPGIKERENASTPIRPDFGEDNADNWEWGRRGSGPTAPPLWACGVELTDVPDREDSVASHRYAMHASRAVAAAEMEKENGNTLRMQSPSKTPQGRPRMSETADHDAKKARKGPGAKAGFLSRLILNSSRVWDPGGVVEGS
jgi:hypothetical protein